MEISSSTGVPVDTLAGRSFMDALTGSLGVGSGTDKASSSDSGTIGTPGSRATTASRGGSGCSTPGPVALAPKPHPGRCPTSITKSHGTWRPGLRIFAPLGLVNDGHPFQVRILTPLSIRVDHQ